MTTNTLTFTPSHTAAIPLNPTDPAKPKGYHKLAAFMGPNTDVAIFRRFGALNMLNLMGLQAELVDLEAQLSDIRREDDSSEDPNRTTYSERFWVLHTALLQVAQINSLGKPEKSDLQFLGDWLRRPGMGNGFLRGREKAVWDEPNHSDLVTLSSLQQEEDLFSKWLRTTVIDNFHRIWGHRSRVLSTPVDPEAGIVRYEESTLIIVANIIGTLLSSLLPIISIIVLYFVKNTLTRLGVMVVFTTLFSATLTIFTSARRVEIFASTAAFSAVEVVFIGSTGVTA